MLWSSNNQTTLARKQHITKDTQVFTYCRTIIPCLYLLKPCSFQYFILSDDGAFPALSDLEATEVPAMPLLQSTDQRAIKPKKRCCFL
jgi:hypothetical protein